MAKGSDSGLRSLSEGFPVKKKEWDNIKGGGFIGPMGTKTYEHWTNFSRDNPTKYEILDEDPKIPGYWSFKTNLATEDFDLMLPSAVTIFLYQMVDIYRNVES